MTEVETLKKEISETKLAISTKIESLESQAREVLSPSHQIRQHPYLAMGISLGAGIIVGSQISHSKKILEPLAMGLMSAVAAELFKVPTSFSD